MSKDDQKQWIKQNWESLCARGLLAKALNKYFKVSGSSELDPQTEGFWNEPKEV